SQVAPLDTLLFNLKQDKEERFDLSKTKPDRLNGMIQEMQNAIGELGELPRSLVVKPPVDHSFLERNKKRLGLKK
ncbi:MAG: hypothetical protein HRT61_23295, partial [Ekhidna sp.]|nr:hypothetical protein [Ekhidna sp.]